MRPGYTILSHNKRVQIESGHEGETGISETHKGENRDYLSYNHYHHFIQIDKLPIIVIHQIANNC